MSDAALWFPSAGLAAPFNPWPGRPGRIPPSGNYWHYLIGYLAPLAGALRRELGPFDEQTPRRLILQSSTPEMNGVAAALIAATPHRLAFHQLGGPGARRRAPGSPGPTSWRGRAVWALPSPFRNSVYALRCILANARMLVAPPRMPNNADGGLETIPLTNWSDARWWWDHRRHPEPNDFLCDLYCLRDLVALTNARVCEARYAKRFLVIQRARREWNQRSLVDAETLARELSDRGLPSVTYEPGAHSVTCQAATFGQAVGVVGVRGAEFANLIWMQPASSVLILETPMPHPWGSPHPLMASLLGLHLAVRTCERPDTRVTAAEVLSELPGA